MHGPSMVAPVFPVAKNANETGMDMQCSTISLKAEVVKSQQGLRQSISATFNSPPKCGEAHNWGRQNAQGRHFSLQNMEMGGGHEIRGKGIRFRHASQSKLNAPAARRQAKRYHTAQSPWLSLDALSKSHSAALKSGNAGELSPMPHPSTHDTAIPAAVSMRWWQVVCRPNSTLLGEHEVTTLRRDARRSPIHRSP